jgi:hypothetical protein
MEKAKADSKSGIEIQQYKAKSQLELNKTNRQLRDAENKVSLYVGFRTITGSIQNKKSFYKD